jgi:hypothetical protein
MGRRFRDTFMGGDARGVWSYVVMEVLIPAAKDAVSDAVSQGVERTLFGDSRAMTRSRRSGSGYLPYNRYSSPAANPGFSPHDPRQISRTARATHSFDEIILETRDEAQLTLNGLFERIEEYGHATVTDLYDLVGITGKFTDEKWGWVELHASSITRVSNGYLLDLPQPVPIN